MSDVLRTVHLYLDLQRRVLVGGPNDNAALTTLELYQGDTYLLILHGLQPVTDTSLTLYQEIPLTYPQILAGLVFLNVPPAGGAWKASFGGNTTGPLAAAIAPKDLEGALNALASVTANGGLDVLIVPNAPSNEWVYQWRTEGATGAITSNPSGLTPLCLTEVAPVPGIAGQYFVKITRAPLTLSDNFASVDPPPVTVEALVAATSTRNMVQRITLPEGAVGQFALTFNGGGTPPFPVDTVAAADIQSALDALMTTTGNFAVKQQATRPLLFDVTFQGSLAAATQPLLGVEMYDQVPNGEPQANLAIPPVPADLVLLGAAEDSIVFEIAGFDASNKKIVLAQQPVTLVAAEINGSTESDLIAAGAVQYIDRTIYIDNTSGEAVVTAAAGASYVPGEAGQQVVITHNLNTWNPVVVVQLEVSIEPQRWRMLTVNAEFDAQSTSLNTAQVTLTQAMSTDPDDPYYFGKYKIFVYSPDATTQIILAMLTWDQVRDTLPEGQTLRQKLSAIDSALGIGSGSFVVQAANISGLIAASQIDLNSLCAALTTWPAFVAMLARLMSNTDIANAIGAALQNSATFESTLEAVLGNPDVLGSLVNALTQNVAFQTYVQNLVTGALSTKGAVAITIPDLTELFPSYVKTIPEDLTTLRAGGLLPAIHVATTTSQAALPLPDPATIIGTVRTNDTGAPILLPGGLGMRGSTLATGGFFGSDGRRLYPLTHSGASTSYFPTDFERELFMFEVNSQMLRPGTNLTLSFALLLQILNATSRAQYHAVIEWGTAPSQAAPATTAENLQDIVWNATPLLRQRIILSGVAVTHQLGIQLIRANDGSLAAKKTVYGFSSDADSVPSSADVALRVRLLDFDTENSAVDAKGNVYLKLTQAQATIQ